MKNLFQMILLISVGNFLLCGNKPILLKDKVKNILIVCDLTEICGKNAVFNHRKEIIDSSYAFFEHAVKKNVYVGSDDKIKVKLLADNSVIDSIEHISNNLYVNMNRIDMMYKRSGELMRRDTFVSALDSLGILLQQIDCNGKQDQNRFYRFLQEDLCKEIISDTSDTVDNFLIYITTGYSEGTDSWPESGKKYPKIKALLLDLDPVDRVGEWDGLQSLWCSRFEQFGIKKTVFEKKTGSNRSIESVNSFLDGKATYTELPCGKPVTTLTEPGKTTPPKITPVPDSSPISKKPPIPKSTETQGPIKSTPSKYDTIQFPDGSVYFGYCRNGLPHGTGSYYYKSSKLFSKNDFKKQMSSPGDSIINGNWENGNLVIADKYYHNGECSFLNIGIP